ncbi:MAG: gamma-glutamyltransferase family protein [Alphaproteobacteria bacterium]|nr:gamma-glutamyltransferase family protein [Alphaproteobacteria bacterium]
MLHSTYATNGMVVAPHHLGAEAGLDVLRDGGNAIEAMVAAAASIAVVYPHMNSIGGDGFWIVAPPDGDPVAIDACGGAAQAATADFYWAHGHSAIPARGAHAALTAAGTVSGWQAALELSGRHGGKLPLARLLADAIGYAKTGVAVTDGQRRNTLEKSPEMEGVPGFIETFLADGEVPQAGDLFRQPELAATLERLAEAGLDDFYRGDIARANAQDLKAVGSPVALGDLESHTATVKEPLSLEIGAGTLYNMPPPTQGLASLLILGAFDRLDCGQADGFDFVHLLVEATKQAFGVRDGHITDPAYMPENPESFLTERVIKSLAAAVDPQMAQDWRRGADKGDTVWLGAIDRNGMAVSFIQSVYWEFGSGVVLPQTGITWQNRGASFALEAGTLNELKPGRKPFHTLNPALARLDDGRVISYGTMGGEGQPQTQAAVFARHVRFGQSLQAAISAPRWLLGRTWGDDSNNLKIEPRFADGVIEALRAAGHDVVEVEPFSDLMGHAGALARGADGVIEGGFDPRSDGRAAGF